MNIDMDAPRERSLSISTNNSRESSILSKTFSIPYYERMEI